MAQPDISLSILAGPPDLPFLARTVPHIVRACRYPFVERVLVADTLPGGRDAAGFLAACRKLVTAGHVDRVLPLDEFHRDNPDAEVKHLGRRVRWRRDFRGVPLLGWVAGLESSRAEYHAHFDSDILIHQAPDFSWLEAGAALLDAVPEVAFVAPHPGPPAPDGSVQQSASFERDARGFLRFDTFSSRRFLTRRDRFARLLPLRLESASRRHRLRALFGRGSPLLNWELMVQKRMREAGLARATLTDPRAWTLHAPDHGGEFVAKLPEIAGRVEAGEFPAGQAGRYDLELGLWPAPSGFKGAAP